MMKSVREYRLIPLVLLATVCLFALKVTGLVFDGGYTLGERLRDRNKTETTTTDRASIPDVTPIIVENQNVQQRSWAQQVFNFPDGKSSDNKSSDITGSVGASPPPAAPPAPKPGSVAAPPKGPEGLVVNQDAPKLAPAGERVILESLQERRTEIDQRNREIEMRENLLKAAEKRLEARVSELKALEGKAAGDAEARDKAEADRLKGLVVMYESMKPKEAARIFDRLDMKVLFDVSSQINPRKMSEILAQMTPEAAERLTVEMASRAQRNKSQSKDALPKIDGRPSGS
jgi:flagellar motility protein MotE (MotC chaperone)